VIADSRLMHMLAISDRRFFPPISL